MRRNILAFGGILLLIFGTLFALQGAGVVRMPADSFMVDDREWLLRGVLIALVGVVLAGAARVIPDKPRAPKD